MASSSKWGSFLQQAVAGVEARLDTILADDNPDATFRRKSSDELIDETKVHKAIPRVSTEEDTPIKTLHSDKSLVSDFPNHVANAPVTDESLALGSEDNSQQNTSSDMPIPQFIERIETLEAKLQYLVKNTNEAARKSIASSSPKSIERFLAEKDEKIASLMKEGIVLSNTEHKYRDIIRRLKSKSVEDQRTIRDLKKQLRALEENIHVVSQASNQVEKLELQLDTFQRDSAHLHAVIERLEFDKSSKEAIVKDLQVELALVREENHRTDTKDDENQDQARQQRKIAELESVIENLKTERKHVEENHHQQLSQLSRQIESLQDEARVADRESKHDLQVMERKLEAMRLYAEDNTTSSSNIIPTNDVSQPSSSISSSKDCHQRNQLERQMEVLQKQYSTARENWQLIEASLSSKLIKMDQEREEATKRESEMRKKARDVTKRCKELEEVILEYQLTQVESGFEDKEVSEHVQQDPKGIDGIQSTKLGEVRLEESPSVVRVTGLEEAIALTDNNEKAQTRRESSSDVEYTKEALQEARREIERLKSQLYGVSSQASNALSLPTYQNPVGDHHRTWLEESSWSQSRLPSPKLTSCVDSPLPSTQSYIYNQGNFLPDFPVKRITNASVSVGAEVAVSNSNPLPPPPLDSTANLHQTLSDLNSQTVAPRISCSLSPSKSPMSEVEIDKGSIFPSDAIDERVSSIDGGFDMASNIGVEFDESSPRADALSVNGTAGPSIQLVGRMSSVIRRLETEKSASKEELTRMISQRDEARREILDLMKDLEHVKQRSNRLTEIETELEEVKVRYQTTLELLGEKSEQVDLLQADLKDLKQMYRELVNMATSKT